MWLDPLDIYSLFQDSKLHRNKVWERYYFSDSMLLVVAALIWVREGEILGTCVFSTVHALGSRNAGLSGSSMEGSVLARGECYALYFPFVFSWAISEMVSSLANLRFEVDSDLNEQPLVHMDGLAPSSGTLGQSKVNGRKWQRGRSGFPRKNMIDSLVSWRLVSLSPFPYCY